MNLSTDFKISVSGEEVEAGAPAPIVTHKASGKPNSLPIVRLLIKFTTLLSALFGIYARCIANVFSFFWPVTCLPPSAYCAEIVLPCVPSNS